MAVFSAGVGIPGISAEGRLHVFRLDRTIGGRQSWGRMSPVRQAWLSHSRFGQLLCPSSTVWASMKELDGPPPDRTCAGCSSGGSSSSTAPAASKELELVPHAGYVFLDDLGDKCVATHSLTCEKVAMVGSGWVVHFDSDGFGVLVPPEDSPQPPIVLDEAMQFMLYKDSAGAFYIVGNNAFAGQVTSLSEMVKKWEARQVTVRVGASSAPRVFEAAAFKWPRPPGSRFAISAKSVYEQLAFDQFSGQQWRWVDSGWRRWKASLAKDFGLGEHIIPSGQMKDPKCAFGL